MGLTAKRQRFVNEYLVDMNATQAAIRAGYSERTARSIGCELLTFPNVAEAIAKAQKALAERTAVTAEKVVSELAKIGFADIRSAVQWRSKVGMVGKNLETEEPEEMHFNEVVLRDSATLDPEIAAAIAEISQAKDGALKVRFHDKQAALVNLGRHLGIFVDRQEHTGKDGKPIQYEGVPPTDMEMARWIALVFARATKESTA